MATSGGAPESLPIRAFLARLDPGWEAMLLEPDKLWKLVQEAKKAGKFVRLVEAKRGQHGVSVGSDWSRSRTYSAVILREATKPKPKKADARPNQKQQQKSTTKAAQSTRQSRRRKKRRKGGGRIWFVQGGAPS